MMRRRRSGAAIDARDWSAFPVTSRELKGGPMTLGFLGRYRETGLLLLRVGIGICFLAHGWGKISNPGMWEQLGGAVGALGLSVPPAVAKALGFMAALSEFGGAICLILGFLFRPACILMAITMGVAVAVHVDKGDGFGGYSHALESMILFVSLVFIGPGKISIERS
jgi:putative oxidoreductase